MAHISYLLGVLFFLQELTILRTPQAYLKKLRHLKKKSEESEKNGKKAFSDYNALDEYEKGIVKMALFSMVYFVWLVIGIAFSSQWVLFLAFTIFGLSISFLRRRFYKNSTRGSISIIKFDAFVSAVALAFIIINHFHNII